MTQLMTHSRQQSFKQCRKQHWYAYERGLRRVMDSKALRQGSAFHEGVEQLGKGESLAVACDAVRKYYDRPDVFDPYEWECERETVMRLVCAYQWRWQEHKLEYLAVEQAFELPLLNPKTGKRTPSFNLAGKIDGIVRLEDGRLAVKETKLLGDDIGNDSHLWRRMRMDQQISLYMHAARRLGYNVASVLYDVARKPTIAPSAVAVLDELGAKVVLDKYGVRVRTDRGTYRQTGDKEKGYTLQTRPMTTEEWGDKLTADIAERPDFYFQRQEVPRLEQDLDEYQHELWQVQQDIRDAQKNNLWYRTVTKNSCSYCSYFDLCSSGKTLGKVAPDGFEFLSDRHPELERLKDERSAAETTTPETVPATDRQESYW